MTAKNKDMVAFLSLVLALSIPAAFVSWCIVTPTAPVPLPPKVELNPSPYGYSWSLVMFIVPVALFGFWMLRTIQTPFRRPAFFWTICLLVPLGCLLDLLLGRTFFTFPNEGAIIKCLKLPAYQHSGSVAAWFVGLFAGSNWTIYVPIEEIFFYALGFVAVLLMYVWADAVLFSDRKVAMVSAPRYLKGILGSIGWSFSVALALFLLALSIRHNVAPENGAHSAFPGYFLFLLACAALPSMICFHIAYHFLNWRALTAAWLFILSISQFWEGSLGLPYGWWDYNRNQMMGLYIFSQCRLPVEAVAVWTLASWTTVVIYETILAILTLAHGGRGSNQNGIPEIPAAPPPKSPKLSAIKELAKPSLSQTAVERLKQEYRLQGH